MKSDKRALFFTLLFTMVCMVLQAQSLQVEGDCDFQVGW